MRILVVISALALMACQAQLKPLPGMPAYQTEGGRRCATGCQSQYNQCLNASRPAGSSSYGVGASRTGGYSSYGLPDNEAINACRQMLRECYHLCSQDDSPSKQ
jgi:hypothetical protein